MKTNLKQYFPMIRTEQELLSEIQKDFYLLDIWKTWNDEQKENFLHFCTGNRGVKILYDSFFKEIMDPYTMPERLNDLLSLLLRQPVHVVQRLPLDSPRIGDESSLLTISGKNSPSS